MEGRGEVARGAAVLVATGILLGLGYNALGLAGNGTRGLAWLSKDKIGELEARGSVEDLQPVDPPAATEPSRPEPAIPFRTAPAPEPGPVPPETASAPSPAPDLPVIPDLERPIMIQLSAVKKLHDGNAALIVDARSPEEYAEGHIAGAVCLPYETAITDPPALEALDSEGRPIVVYCGGGTCEISISLAEALMFQAGKKRVVVFMGGMPEWEAAGYPVERGAGG